MRIEGELFKLFLDLESLELLSQEGSTQEVSFLEVLNKLMAQTPSENTPNQEVLQNEVKPTKDNLKEKAQDTNLGFEKLLPLLIPQSFQPIETKSVTQATQEKTQVELDESLTKDLPKGELPITQKLDFKNPVISFDSTKSENLEDYFAFPKAKKIYELVDFPESKTELSLEQIQKFKEAESVLSTEKGLTNKEFNSGALKESPHRAYDLQISSLPEKVKESEVRENFLPVIREAVFKEEGHLKRASLKLENLNLEVRLIKDRIDLQFFLPQGKENVLGFFDYLRISQILNSMGLRVESFVVNGQEFNKTKTRDREKDNINLNEPNQKDRGYLNASPSFSVVL